MVLTLASPGCNTVEEGEDKAAAGVLLVSRGISQGFARGKAAPALRAGGLRHTQATVVGHGFGV